jgi:trehalose 6-phosphate phosphatase
MCLDFDGTLAPIVDDPNEARPLPGTVELLGHLAARFAAVALLSGRPADYLAEYAAAPGVRYLGLYGLEEIRDGHVWVDPRLEAARPAVMAAQQDLRSCATVRDSGEGQAVCRCHPYAASPRPCSLDSVHRQSSSASR